MCKWNINTSRLRQTRGRISLPPNIVNRPAKSYTRKHRAGTRHCKQIHEQVNKYYAHTRSRLSIRARNGGTGTVEGISKELPGGPGFRLRPEQGRDPTSLWGKSRHFASLPRLYPSNVCTVHSARKKVASINGDQNGVKILCRVHLLNKYLHQKWEIL